MKIFLNMTYEEFVIQFKNDVVQYDINPALYKTIGMKDELIGKITGNNFWLQKTRPRWICNKYTRQFRARIRNDEQGIVIYGRFIMTGAKGGLPYIYFALFTFIVAWLSQSVSTFFLVVGGLGCIFIIGNLINRTIHRKETLVVIEYLKALQEKYSNEKGN